LNNFSLKTLEHRQVHFGGERLGFACDPAGLMLGGMAGAEHTQF
jgi:hypothetical protein